MQGYQTAAHTAQITDLGKSEFSRTSPPRPRATTEYVAEQHAHFLSLAPFSLRDCGVSELQC